MKVGLETHNRRTTSLLPVLLLAGAILLGVTQAACGGEKELKRDFSGLNPEKCGGSGRVGGFCGGGGFETMKNQEKKQ
jgi:hypothetical protein